MWGLAFRVMKSSRLPDNVCESPIDARAGGACHLVGYVARWEFALQALNESEKIIINTIISGLSGGRLKKALRTLIRW